MIIYFVLITKQHILCGWYKENLHTDELAGAERVIEKINVQLIIFLK